MGDVLSVFTDLYGLISPVTDSIANFARTGSDPFGEFYSKAIICIALFFILRIFVNLGAEKLGVDVTKNKTYILLFVWMIAIASSFTIPRELLRAMFSLGSLTIVVFVLGAILYATYLFYKKTSGAFGENKILLFIFYLVFTLIIIMGGNFLGTMFPAFSEIIKKAISLIYPVMTVLCVFSFLGIASDFFKGSNQARSIERRNSIRNWMKGKWKSLRDKVPPGLVKNLFSRVKGAMYNYDPKPIVADIVRGTNEIGRFFTGCDAIMKAGTPLDKIHVDTFEASHKNLENNLNKLRRQVMLLEDNEQKGELLSKIDAYFAFFKDIKVKEGITTLRSSKKSKDASDKFYVLDASTFIWLHNLQNIVIALKDYYAYFYNLYNRYDSYFPKESTFENELAVALNVKSIEEETEKLIVVLKDSEKTYVKAKKLRQDAHDIYKGLESAHPNAFVSYAAKYSLHSHFLDDFLTWVGINGKDYVINETTFGIHETNVIRQGLHKYRYSLRRHLTSLKRSDKEKKMEQEIKFLEGVGSYIDRLFFILSDLLKLEFSLVKGEELKKASYFESIERIIAQINTEANQIDDKDYTTGLAPKMQELARISAELKNLRESRLSVSYEYEYREEQRLLNELLTFLK